MNGFMTAFVAQQEAFPLLSWEEAGFCPSFPILQDCKVLICGVIAVNFEFDFVARVSTDKCDVGSLVHGDA